MSSYYYVDSNGRLVGDSWIKDRKAPFINADLPGTVPLGIGPYFFPKRLWASPDLLLSHPGEHHEDLLGQLGDYRFLGDRPYVLRRRSLDPMPSPEPTDPPSPEPTDPPPEPIDPPSPEPSPDPTDPPAEWVVVAEGTLQNHDMLGPISLPTPGRYQFELRASNFYMGDQPGAMVMTAEFNSDAGPLPLLDQLELKPLKGIFVPAGGGGGVAQVIDSAGMVQYRAVGFVETQPLGGGAMSFAEASIYSAARKTPTNKVIPKLEVNRTGLTAGAVAMIDGKSQNGTKRSHTFRIGWPLMIAGGPAPRANIDLPLTPRRPSLGLRMAREGKEHANKAAEFLRSGNLPDARKYLDKANRAYKKLYQAKRWTVMKVIGH